MTPKRLKESAPRGASLSSPSGAVTPKEFKAQMERLHNQALFPALTYYWAWRNSFPTKGHIDGLNFFKGFFQPARAALNEMLLVHVAKVFDHDSRAISLPKLLNAARSDSKLVPNAERAEVDLTLLKEQLERHRNTVANVIQHRNQFLAHLDLNPLPRVEITQGEIDSLFADVKHVFSKLSVAHDGSSWLWKPVEDEVERYTKHLMESLAAGRRERIRALDRLSGITRGE